MESLLCRNSRFLRGILLYVCEGGSNISDIFFLYSLIAHFFLCCHKTAQDAARASRPHPDTQRTPCQRFCILLSKPLPEPRPSAIGHNSLQHRLRNQLSPLGSKRINHLSSHTTPEIKHEALPLHFSPRRRLRTHRSSPPSLPESCSYTSRTCRTRCSGFGMGRCGRIRKV